MGFLFAFASALLAASLSSCTIYQLVPNRGSSSLEPITDDSEIEVEFEKDYVQDGVYQAPDFLKRSLREVSYRRGMDLPPSTGNVNVLVLPIQFSDYPFSADVLSNVSNALSGTDTGYWESLASFYEKSSYGKLHLSFHMASVYQTGMTATEGAKLNYSFSQNDQDSCDNAQYFINKAVEAYSDEDAPLTDFDQDDDGIIDAIIAVYSCPDYSKHTYRFSYGKDSEKISDSSLYWAFTYWCSNSGDLSSPKANTFVWLSYDFFSSQGNADPHTIIHEYGHAMGLDDYYTDQSDFQPAGGIDMMDLNIVDHDVYSKASLGWTSPYIVDGDDVTLTIRPSESSGDCVLIPTSSFNGTLWDEYIMLELYTPDGLNEFDTKNSYGGYPKGYSIPGIKIYHVDSRLVCCKYGGSQSRILSSPYVYDPNSIDPYASSCFYMVAATNCSKDFNSSQILSSNRAYSSTYSLIHLIEKGGINTFAKGKTGTNGTLFTGGSSFSLDQYGNNFFPRRSAMNNGKSFPYLITVESVSSQGATLHFEKRS